MDLLDKLAEQLDEQINPKQEQVETPQMTQELYEALIEKKMSDMELRLNATISKLIEQNLKPTGKVEETKENTQPTEEVEQEGEKQ